VIFGRDEKQRLACWRIDWRTGGKETTRADLDDKEFTERGLGLFADTDNTDSSSYGGSRGFRPELFSCRNYRRNVWRSLAWQLHPLVGWDQARADLVRTPTIGNGSSVPDFSDPEPRRYKGISLWSEPN